MRKSLIFGAALAAVVAGSGAAQAQTWNRYDNNGYDRSYSQDRSYDRYDNYDRGNGYDRGGYDRSDWRNGRPSAFARIDWMQQRINAGRSDGSLNDREYQRSASQLRRIRQMAYDLQQRGGGTLNKTDAAYIQERLDLLGQQLHWDRND